jgi:hypothetical protein
VRRHERAIGIMTPVETGTLPRRQTITNRVKPRLGRSASSATHPTAFVHRWVAGSGSRGSSRREDSEMPTPAFLPRIPLSSHSRVGTWSPDRRTS